MVNGLFWSLRPLKGATAAQNWSHVCLHTKKNTSPHIQTKKLSRSVHVRIQLSTVKAQQLHPGFRQEDLMPHSVSV